MGKVRFQVGLKIGISNLKYNSFSFIWKDLIEWWFNGKVDTLHLYNRQN